MKTSITCNKKLETEFFALLCFALLCFALLCFAFLNKNTSAVSIKQLTLQKALLAQIRVMTKNETR